MTGGPQDSFSHHLMGEAPHQGSNSNDDLEGSAADHDASEEEEEMLLGNVNNNVQDLSDVDENEQTQKGLLCGSVPESNPTPFKKHYSSTIKHPNSNAQQQYP